MVHVDDPPARVRAEHAQKSDGGFRLFISLPPWLLCFFLSSLAQENRAGQNTLPLVLIVFPLLPKGAGRCVALLGWFTDY